MAMDKEKLLSYFQAHYLSRQEVLFKLPLNISIDSFWPELLNRRKARAQLLPLYNASGMPYWYVLTDRMVAASERLCEEAIGQDTAFDPYRAGMTSAMTEEMFFTSFVEGAQIPLQEAMDFLQRGTEPESIQEQMIWNNRRAWAEMTATIYRPLDGNFVRGLAFMLTEEMDDCAEDYRQNDQHPIAAMNNESYEVPPACVLPDRMNEYYDFLQKPDIHPLIKAAVAQAYLLVTRPFPEGNERLSRMMSSAVLLRSGYDFFRDISISSVIARESYRYYKCMCDIIRSENGGDLTYFLQYYLELLVRALDVRNERQRKREQEAREREQETLRQERELTRKPLTPTVQPCEEDNIDWDVPDDADGTPLPKPPAPVDDEPADAEDVDTADPESPFVNSYSRVQQPLPLMEPDRFLQAISKLKHSRYPIIRDMPDKVNRMIETGVFRFSVGQWAEMHSMDHKYADYECRYMYEKGWMSREKEGRYYVYSLRIIIPQQEALADDSASPPEERSEDKGPPGDEYFQTMMDRMLNSRSDHVRQTAETIQVMISNGVTSFTRQEWMKQTGMSLVRTSDACDYLVSHRLVHNVSTQQRSAVYVFSHLEEKKIADPSEPADQPAEALISEPGDPPSEALISELQEMLTGVLGERKKNIASILLSFIEKGVYSFRTDTVMKNFDMPKSTCISTLRTAVNLGYLHKEPAQGESCHYLYVINMKRTTGIRGDALTHKQKEILMALYQKFKSWEFSVRDGTKVVPLQENSLAFHLHNFAQCGILTVHEGAGRADYYTFVATPKRNPDCFLTESSHVRAQSTSSSTSAVIPMAAASA